MRLARLHQRNAGALAERRSWDPRRRSAASTHSSAFHELRQQFPYFGYVEVEVDELTPFLMLSNNDDHVAQMYFWYGTDAFEPLSLQIWSRLVRTADVVFDVGAFTGVYSLVAAQAAPDAEIHAFEPVRRVFGRLVDNLAVNARGMRVNAHNVALSDVTEEARMKIFRGHRTLSSGSSLVGKPSKAAMSTEPVETVRGDKYAREIGVDHVDLVKVDVEGAEEIVVDGLGDLLDGRPDLIIEVSSPESLDGIQRRLGPDYAVVILDDLARTARPGDPDGLGAFSNVLFTAMPTDRLEALLSRVGR